MNTACIEDRKQKVSQGIDLFLSMFEKAGQKPFPRKIMTFISNGQFVVNSKEDMLQRFKESQFIDCRNLHGEFIYPFTVTSNLCPQIPWHDWVLSVIVNRNLLEKFSSAQYAS